MEAEGGRVGLFVTIEGPEGAGKSTQVALLDHALAGAGYVVCQVREPGDTPLGDHLRELLLAPSTVVSPRAEALLYCAARAELVENVIRPALASGAVVIADRYADSTLAYQGAGRGLPLDALTAVVQFAIAGCRPDLTILLDLPVEDGLARKEAATALRPAEWTRFERETVAFHERVRAGYRRLAAAEPGRWLVLDARAPAEALHATIWGAVQRRLSRGG
ncbi:MAG: dTMP kinase [Chloroflexi bacterium]|nr:dTMP kinase [Chloroflexota bacterium]